MRITLNDGSSAVCLNLLDKTTDVINLKRHAMRFHIVENGLARKQFTTKDRDLIKSIYNTCLLKTAGLMSDGTYAASSWIYVNQCPHEFWPVESFSGINLRTVVTKDLESYWGSRVVVTGMAVRDIKYISDGNMSTTPDAIGKYRGSPLIYSGKAVATIFEIDGADVLRSDSNVVYWLPKPWWNGFHNNFRGVSRDFPGRTGFVCSNWCQRSGHRGYNSGIFLASMTQGQSVGSWSVTQLPMMVPSVVPGKHHSLKTKKKKIEQAELQLKMWRYIEKNKPKLGYILTVCPVCGGQVDPGYNCKYCGAVFPYNLNKKKACTKCGRLHDYCTCEEESANIILASDQDLREYASLLHSASYCHYQY